MREAETMAQSDGGGTGPAMVDAFAAGDSAVMTELLAADATFHWPRSSRWSPTCG
jgi:hypothetical protein